jgi:hypothetical protein
MISALRKLSFAIVFLTALMPFTSSSQDLTGIWRGRFETFAGDEYRFEIQIEQTSTNRISGVSYSYLDVRFYGKATLTGYFTKNSGSALIQEIKTVEVKSLTGGGACIMKCQFVYTKSGKEEFLEGTYTSVEEGSDPPVNCGGGTVMLRKVTTSDFYIEPFLRNKVEEDKPVRKEDVKKPATKPQNKPVTKPVVKKPPVVQKPQKDSSVKKAEPIVNTRPVETPVFKIPETTRSRKNELLQTFSVTNDEIIVRLYDNGEIDGDTIDGDTISVYLDGKSLVSNKGLSTSPITLKLKMDTENPEHVLIMVAENLGRIPPNTSLMLIHDGDKRYQVSITSTEQKNAMVRFRYQKKSD